MFELAEICTMVPHEILGWREITHLQNLTHFQAKYVLRVWEASDVHLDYRIDYTDLEISYFSFLDSLDSKGTNFLSSLHFL